MKDVVDTVDVKDCEMSDAEKEEKKPVEEKKKIDLKKIGKKALKVAGVILVGGAAFLGANIGTKKNYTDLSRKDSDPAPAPADPAPASDDTTTEWKEF